METAFSAELRDAGPDACALALRGRLDARSEAALVDAHNRTRHPPRERAASRVLLDGRELSALDGAGLGLLMKLWGWTRSEGQGLGLFGFGERFGALLREVGLADALPLFPTEEAALTGAPRGPAAPASGGPEPCPPGEWAVALGRARLGSRDPGGSALNVDGRRVQGPLQGFGQLWHKTYSVRLGAVPSGEAARILREHLGDLWPEGNRLFLPPPGVVPGAVGAIHLRMPGGAPLSTGVRVLHADDSTFTLATLEGHLQAGWITFGAHDQAGGTVALVQSVGRTGDPLYEMGFRLFGHAEQERFWGATLAALGTRLGVAVRVEAAKVLLDPAVNWSAAGNLWRNAGVRTGLSAAAALAGRLLGGRRS